MRAPRSGVFVLLLVLGLTPLQAQTGAVAVELRPEEITVGDRVTARITLVWDGETPAAAPRFPAWQGAWGAAEVLEVGAVESFGQAGRRVYSQSLVLTVFTTGEIELPPVTVTMELDGRAVEVRTRGGARLNVVSVLPRDRQLSELEPRPPAPFAPVAAGRRFLWTAAVLAALCGLAAAALAWRLARRGAPGAAPRTPLTPLEELMAAVTRIDPGAGSEPAHTAMSLALRRYLGRTLGFQAPERTTSEITRDLRRTRLASDVVDRALGLLSRCDQVKFARREVPEAETVSSLVALQEIGRDVDDALRPPEYGQSFHERDLGRAA